MGLGSRLDKKDKNRKAGLHQQLDHEQQKVKHIEMKDSAGSNIPEKQNLAGYDMHSKRKRSMDNQIDKKDAGIGAVNNQSHVETRGRVRSFRNSQFGVNNLNLIQNNKRLGVNKLGDKKAPQNKPNSIKKIFRH